MKYIYTILSFILAINLSQAQSGVNTQVVNPHTVLHIDAPNKDKGILIPRLTMAERDLIPTTETEDGLAIYNVDEDCMNYWSKAEAEWKSVCGKLGKAIFTVSNCDDIEVSGQYLDKTATTPSNYITVIVKVTKIGTYSITAVSDPDNGYYFTLSGEFLSVGDYELKVPAMGTPKTHKVDQFSLLLNGLKANGEGAACTFEVIVEDSSIKPLYRMDCSNVTVNGVYKIDEALTASNTISVKLEVKPEAIGSTYSIQSDFVEGISFSGSGLLTSTSQTVTLYGSGVPASATRKKMTLVSNSKLTAAICMTTVTVVIPSKKLLTIGSDKNGYGYNFSGNAASNKLITSKSNYGDLPTSVVGFEGWTIIDGGVTSNANQLKVNLLGANPVDVLVLGYAWTMDEASADVITQYLVKGGVVLAFTESALGVSRLMRRLSGNSEVKAASFNAAGALYELSFVNDGILNGPFGDIRGLTWGEDASATVRVYGLDTGSLEVYSNALDRSSVGNYQEGLTAFRHRDYSFVYVGDGGFNSNHSGTSNTICPFKLDSNNFPIPKPNYGRGSVASRREVVNSIFTANAFAWAIEQAHFNGINSNK